MVKELRYLEKNYQTMTQEEIWSAIRKIRPQIKEKNVSKNALDFATILFKVFQLSSKKGETNIERVILNQIVELAWWSDSNKELISILIEAIYQMLVDSRPIQGINREELFLDYLEILNRFPENKEIYNAISKAVVELIRWGRDVDILDILDIMKQKAISFPMVESIQVLNATVYMNVLFYLTNQKCQTILEIYNDFSCVAISNFDERNNDCIISELFLQEDINEILQEGSINAIINLARSKEKSENKQICHEGIRRIINDSEFLFKKEKEFFKDVYRLSHAFDQFDLWDDFVDIPFIKELKNERDKNKAYEQGKGKLLAIVKQMRIEEYDSLKIGRRGLLLKYNPNEIEDIRRLVRDLKDQFNNKEIDVNLVKQVDAVIELDDEIRESLRESGQIPIDKKTVDELQDLTTKSDDLTKPVTNEAKIVEKIDFLTELQKKNSQHLSSELLLTKGLIFSVGMFGFESYVLNLKKETLRQHVERLAEMKMTNELIDPIVRAITLRAGRLDVEATCLLLGLLSKYGLKFLERIYEQYHFIDNLMRLLSFVGRRGEIKKGERIISEVSKANRLYLNDDEIPIRLARALNEGLLSFTAKDQQKKIELLEILRDLAKRHSYSEEMQIKLVEGMNFLILGLGFDNWRRAENIVNDLLEFSKSYRQNQAIEEKAAIGVLFFILQLQYNSRENRMTSYQQELKKMVFNHPNSSFLLQINQIAQSL
jgi:hypothetical protein